MTAGAAAARTLRRLPVTHAAALIGAVGVGALAGLAMAVDPRIGALLAVAAVVVPIAIADPPLAIALWVALGPVSSLSPFGIAGTAAGLLAVGAWWGLARSDRMAVRAALRPHRPLLASIALLLAWLTLSLSWADDPSRGGAELVHWYVSAVALVVMLGTLRMPRDVRLVTGALVAGTLLSAAIGLAGVGHSEANEAVETATRVQGRLQGGAGDPNVLAAFVVVAIVLAAAGRRLAGPAQRLALPAVIAALVVALGATQSRGGALAGLAALLTALLVMRGRRRAVLGAAAAIACVAFVYFSVNPTAYHRLTSAAADRGNGRGDLWLMARRMAADHPALGVGLDNFAVRARDYVRHPGALSFVDLIAERPHVVHNAYLEMLADAGAIGLALLAAFLALAVTSAVRAARAFERIGETALAEFARSVVVADVALLTAITFLSIGSSSTVWVVLALGPVLLGIAHARAASESLVTSGTAG
jgi:O-antigen ligase